MEEHISFFLTSNDRDDVNNPIFWECLEGVTRLHKTFFTSAEHKAQEAALKDVETKHWEQTC